tara:strand:- start:465 stop:1424 length:960 start_codon:yes stop_codon:yes gene_type:complete
MIDSVRKTVLSILNKNNYGYITPADFNLYAKQAQLDIFDDYFYDYNYQINKENARASGTGYANIRKGYEEVIDGLSETKFLRNRNILTTDTHMFFAPSQTTTGDDYYLINRVEIFPTSITTGNNTLAATNALVDTGGVNFITLGVSVGDAVVNTVTGDAAYVAGVTSNILLLDGNIFTTDPVGYKIFDATDRAEAEMVSQAKIMQLSISLLTSPTTIFPAYTLDGDYITMYPNTVNEPGQVLAQYIRYPKDPKWTYVTLTGGEPVFDSTQADYQDFELALDDQVDLVIKILQYAGMSIREVQAVQFAQAQEQLNIQEEK